MKHVLIICLAVVALALPAVGLAANGGGNGSTSPAPAAKQGHGNDALAQLRELGKQLKDRVAECRKASRAARKECVDRLISFLEDVKEKINAAEETIRESCKDSGPAAGSAADRCARVQKLVDRLEQLKARIDQFEDKLRSGKGLDSSSSAGRASGPSSSSTDTNLAAIVSQLGTLGP